MSTITTTATARNSRGHSASLTKDFTYEDLKPSDFDRIVTERLPGGATIPEGQAWWCKGIVETDANVIAYGLLHQQPGDWLDFKNVDELAYVGGGMEPLPTDTGLWIMDGVWDICGTSKVGWNRTGDDPSWQDSDELRSTPIASGDFTTFAPFRRGSQVPSGRGPKGEISAEVLNLTRDCGVRGEPNARAHVFIHSQKPQRICHATLQHLGPRQPDGKFTKDVLGRYGLHLHHCGDGSRGSVVESVVVRDCGSHAFVPHTSHGIRFSQCVSFNTLEHAYWWDEREISNDVNWDDCVAALVDFDPDFRGGRLSGFFLGLGDGLTCRSSVAVGVLGGSDSTSGFHWPESGSGVWAFEDCVGHNNKVNGIHVWQNSPKVHVIDRFVGFNNGLSDINHGAYGNHYQYRDCELSGSKWALIHHTASTANPQQRWERCRFDGPLLFTKPLGSTPRAPVLLLDCTQTGRIRIDHTGAVAPHNFRHYDFVKHLVNGKDLEPQDFDIVHLHPGSVVRVQRRDGSAYRVNDDKTVETVPAFYTEQA